MSYRPICDFWWLARAKLKGGRKYYGAYLGGFPERARVLLGVTINDPVLHVCGGMARHYPYAGGFGPNDQTLDLDPATQPDYLADARESFPLLECSACGGNGAGVLGPDTCGNCCGEGTPYPDGWPAILMDPPYSEIDAAEYVPGAAVYPKPNLLLRNALQAVRPGGRVGLIHYIVPAPPPASIGFGTKFIASVGIGCGFNNRVRVYTVWERLAE